MRASAPSGWLACNGGSYAKSTYPDLFNILINLPSSTRSTWGNADWSTNFNVPNLQGEFLRGTGTNSHTNEGGNGAAVGMHQRSTMITSCWDGDFGHYFRDSRTDIYEDFRIRPSNYTWRFFNYNQNTNQQAEDIASFGIAGIKPTNTSVLWCIKY